jgi:hypothetical protein
VMLLVSFSIVKIFIFQAPCAPSATIKTLITQVGTRQADSALLSEIVRGRSDDDVFETACACPPGNACAVPARVDCLYRDEPLVSGQSSLRAYWAGLTGVSTRSMKFRLLGWDPITATRKHAPDLRV